MPSIKFNNCNCEYLKQLTGDAQMECRACEDSFVGMSLQEIQTELRLKCVAQKAECTSLCTCGGHRWDANAMNGLGDVVSCNFNEEADG